MKIQANAFWKRGLGVANKYLAPAFSMVYSRISRIDADLALKLFQPANARQSAIGRSWEQRSRAVKGRMHAQVDAFVSEAHKGLSSGAQKRSAIQQAFEDAYTGKPTTDLGKKAHALLRTLMASASAEGLKSVDLSRMFVADAMGEGPLGPVVFNRQALANRPADFSAMLKAAKIDDMEAREIQSRIIDGPGVLEGAIAPGMPVGMHKTNQELVAAIGYEALRDGGWLLSSHLEALFHWVDGVSKRSAWEGIFGGQKMGEAFDPNHRFIASLDAIRAKSGDKAAQEVLELVNGALGRHPAGQNMPGWWRSTQDFIVGWAGMTVLAFSGIASIPELALPLVRAGGKVSLREMFESVGDARRFAKEMGIVISDASEQVMWQATGDQYQSPLINKMQRHFFRWNGNELIVKTARTLGTGIGIRYLLNAAANGDNDALAKLNIDAGTVAAWDKAGRPVWKAGLTGVDQQLAIKVTDAVNQFVNEATLNPSKFQATNWGNNPYMKVIWHLKHFLYTYGDTVLLGMYREMKSRWSHLNPQQFGQAMAVAMPALVFGMAVLPLAAASLEARDWMRRLNGQKTKAPTDALEYFGDVFSRAGGLGPIEFLSNMKQQQEWGMSVWGSVSPVAGKVDTLFSNQKSSEKLRQLLPILSQNKGLWQMVAE